MEYLKLASHTVEHGEMMAKVGRVPFKMSSLDGGTCAAEKNKNVNFHQVCSRFRFEKNIINGGAEVLAGYSPVSLPCGEYRKPPVWILLLKEKTGKEECLLNGKSFQFFG